MEIHRRIDVTLSLTFKRQLQCAKAKFQGKLAKHYTSTINKEIGHRTNIWLNNKHGPGEMITDMQEYQK